MIYIMLLCLLLIHPTPGVSSIELNPSDPQGKNQTLIAECVAKTGKCAVWYAPGTYHIVNPIVIQRGVKDVYGGGATIIPCSPKTTYIFAVEARLGQPDVPWFHDFKVDDSKPCGGFVPPMTQFIMYGINPPPPPHDLKSVSR